jgi:hypothetical protein
MKSKTSPLYFVIFGPPSSPPMEGGSAERCWSREEEGVFITAVLQAVDIKKTATVKDYDRRFT